MIPLSSTENKPLEFVPVVGESSQKTKAPTNKIGWLHTLADAPNASFDISIRDALGRKKFEEKNCSSGNEKFGRLINLPTRMGEDLEVVIENLKGAKNLKVFLN